MLKNTILAALIMLITAGTINAQTGDIAPMTPPEVRQVEILSPPPPPTPEVQLPAKAPGYFGWDLKSEINGGFYPPGILAAGLNVLFADPYHLGAQIGLAEDALEFKAGLNLALGSFFTLPLYGGATLYFKEGSLFGFDPFTGVGLNLTTGGLGYQLYGGMLLNLGRPEKTALLLGYNSYRIEGSRSFEGIFFSLCQPIKL